MFGGQMPGGKMGQMANEPHGAKNEKRQAKRIKSS